MAIRGNATTSTASRQAIAGLATAYRKALNLRYSGSSGIVALVQFY
jgi:hypothetical protein